MTKNFRNVPGYKVQDPSIIQNLEYSEAAGSKKVSEVGRHLIPIPYKGISDIEYTTDIASSVGSQTIQPVADSSGSLNNTYFLLESQTGNKYAMWFNVSGGGSAPSVPGYTAEEVDIATNDLAATVGAALRNAINALNGGLDFTASGSSTVTVVNNTAGTFTPASDNNTGFAFAVVAPGSGGPLPLPSSGLCLAVYNSDTTTHSLTLGEDSTTVPLAAGQTDANGHVGIPCAPGWTYIACNESNWVITDDDTLMVFIIDDNSSIKVLK